MWKSKIFVNHDKSFPELQPDASVESGKPKEACLNKARADVLTPKEIRLKTDQTLWAYYTVQAPPGFSILAAIFTVAKSGLATLASTCASSHDSRTNTDTKIQWIGYLEHLSSSLEVLETWACSGGTVASDCPPSRSRRRVSPNSELRTRNFFFNFFSELVCERKE